MALKLYSDFNPKTRLIVLKTRLIKKQKISQLLIAVYPKKHELLIELAEKIDKKLLVKYYKVSTLEVGLEELERLT